MTDQLAFMEVLERLRSLPREASTVEFKSNLNEPVEIGQDLSTLANSAVLEGHDRAWLVWEGWMMEPMTSKGRPSIRLPRRRRGISGWSCGCNG